MENGTGFRDSSRRGDSDSGGGSLVWLKRSLVAGPGHGWIGRPAAKDKNCYGGLFAQQALSVIGGRHAIGSRYLEVWGSDIEALEKDRATPGGADPGHR